jgi:predicted CXXCH cytochrome family protein
MKRLIALVALIAAGSGGSAFSQSVVNTVHNLSVSGPGTVRAVSETEVCLFCHTPHQSKPASPLWNRQDPGVTYVLYNSSTAQAMTGQPDGSSILCLSCHDGTIALGNVLNRTADILMTGGITRMPPGNKNLTTDLSDDHPVSFLYNSALAASDGQLKDPSEVLFPVTLENGRLQCTSCHDPHRDIYGSFLVVSNQFSGLCSKCHERDYWAPSAHNTSTKTWNGAGADPWPHTSFTTVTENGCENCHDPHNAQGKYRLLDNLAEENNCLSCHDGNVASTNISSELVKPYIHNVAGYTLVHDANENELVTTRHVECVDCHNSHAVNNITATAPAANGFLLGAGGINQSGNPVNPVAYQYEVCYRCHADSPDKPASLTLRQIVQNNVRLEFDPSSPSYHPVAAAGKNSYCPSLISPSWTVTSFVYCTDCHAGNGAGATSGPHGSIYPGILKLRYDKADNTPESASAYELCYSCHSRTSILSDVSFGEHRRHIVEENTPCNACHDPHGISSTQGNTTNNSHLINFDRSIVSPTGSGNLRYVSTGTGQGYCQLSCHGKVHTWAMTY